MFYAWRNEVINIKRMKVSLKIRVYNALNHNRMRNKQQKVATMMVLRKQDEYMFEKVQCVFNALRMHKELEKQNLVKERLASQENVLIEENEASIRKVKAKAQQVAKTRAMKNGVIYPFTLYLKSYFAHWKNMNDETKIALTKKFKVNVIKVYHDILRDAFFKFKNQESKK